MEDNLRAERERLIALVKQHFQGLQRGPYGVEKALEEAKQANANSTQRIILGESELAWRAYYAAKKATDSQHGFSGRAEFARLLDGLSTQSIEQQRAFAKELILAIESDALQLPEDDGGTGARKGTKRRRTTMESPILSTSPPNATPNGPGTNYTNLEHGSSQEILNSLNVQEGVHVDASLQASGALFPVEFMESVRRIPHSRLADALVADISMFLQQGYIRDHFGCQMEIGIAKEKVPFYAKKLFNVEVETKDGVRHLLYQGGGKIEPDPCIKLRACRRDVLSGVFGLDVSIAFLAAPICQREKREVRAHTDGVSMTISNQETDGGRITLFLGAWHAFNIKEKLYS
ncbi:hypothetical protein CC78DRAFT_527107 [Lojkania enalia]|uniref:Uncharacterized protein n=1 Tax=Lojkania enalia TaxID=147567 RepID=A0A9P4MUK0_9PLEO|nr:hypothetical protein CC78DRAFT_527107 [Didymosphaeria enalia]